MNGSINYSMKNLLLTLFSVIFIVFSGFSQEIVKKTSIARPIIAGHLEVEKFDSIPDSLLPEIAALKLMFRHASVGTTIDNGLNCLQGTRSNPPVCKTFPPYKYDRRNWHFQLRGNSGWYGKITDFMNETRLQADSYDIFGFKYCYLDGLDELSIPCGKPFSDAEVSKAWSSLRDSMESLENQYPDQVFIWATIPLTQPGQHCTDTLNKLIRAYVRENHKVLFDIADIQCHDSNHQKLLNAYGWEMAFAGWCGEKPPGPSCHPNWTGSVMLAKAFWWMMATLSGWSDTVLQDIPIQHENVTRFQISPNPVSENAQFQFILLNTSDISVSIYAVTGQMLKNVGMYRQLLLGQYLIKADISDLPDGIYMLKIKSNYSWKVEKLIKRHY